MIYIFDNIYLFHRGPAFTAFKMMREKRSDIFYETTGVLMEDGKKWHAIRSKGGHSKNVLKLLVLSEYFR